MATGQAPSFEQLLEQSRQLTTHIVSPHINIERGLTQIAAQTKRLMRKTTTKDEPNIGKGEIDNRASYLLANRGFDAQKVSKTLDELDLSLTFEPLQGVPDTDIEGFLRNEHENIISIAIEKQKTLIISDFEAAFEDKIHSDWQQTKRKIMEDLGYQSQANLTRMEEDNYHVPKQIPGKGAMASNPRLAGYAKVVRELNDARLAGRPYNALSAFRSAARQISGDNQQQTIAGYWNLLAQMLGSRHENIDAVNPGHFSKNWKAASDLSSDTGYAFRSQMIKGARTYLEDSYRTWLAASVRSHSAEIGGMPSLLTEIKALVATMHFKNGKLNSNSNWIDKSIGNTPFWAHLFTFVRMGRLEDGLEYIDEYQHDLSNSYDKNFRAYYVAWMESADGQLPKALRDRLLGEWNSRIRDYLSDAKSMPKGDAFKYALYKIIGRCEPAVKTVKCSQVINTTDDYIWFNLHMIQEGGSSGERYTLFDFSKRMQKYGLDYFKNSTNWFLVLLVCGEFELAVSELFQDEFYCHDALHFGIAMAYYGVLRVPSNPKSLPLAQKLVSCETKGDRNLYYLHFSRMIHRFCRNWIANEPLETLPYVYLESLFFESNKKEYMLSLHQHIREILKTCHDFPRVVGEIRPGTMGRHPGHLEKYRTLIGFTSEKAYVDGVILVAANDAEKDGRHRDALQLYHLGFQFNKVLQLINSKLGDELLSYGIYEQQDLSHSLSRSTDENFQLDSNPLETAQKVLDYYKSKPTIASQLDTKILATSNTLIQLLQSRLEIQQNRDESGLSLLYQTGIFPEEPDMALIQSKSKGFKDLNELVARAIPDMIFLAANSLFKLYNNCMANRFDANEQRAQLFKQRFKSLLLFAGSINYRVSREIFAKLNKLEVAMG